MKRRNNHEQEPQQNPAIIHLLLAIYKSRLPIDDSDIDREKQITNFLLGSEQPEHTYNLADRGLSIGYKFGEYLLKNYPKFTARGDEASSLDSKTKNLAQIGVQKEVVKIFEQISDPKWGFTFKGVRIDETGLHFKLDRSKTYNPFRQNLELHIDQKGIISWTYDFTVYVPESLYFRIPSDTWTVSNPEFQGDHFTRTPVSISGTVSKTGQLEFSNLKFGGMGFTSGNPNYTLKKLTKGKIYLEQIKSWAGKKHLDYEITSCSVDNMLRYITQPDINIDTNPLFKAKHRATRKVGKPTE